MNKAVFIDRDGTLNEMVYDETHGILDSPRRPEDVRLKDHAAQFIRAVKQCGYSVIIVTNQPGLAKGILSLESLRAINLRLASLLAEEGAAWDDLRYCPHFPDHGHPGNAYAIECDCRKPKPGMLLAASRDLHINLTSSWMVGDGLNDVQAGKAAGCRSILVTKLKTEQVERFFSLDNCQPDAIAADLMKAAGIIQAG